MDYTKEDILIKEEITEKITNNDYTGARFLLLETLKTFPRLENASEILTICEILCSAKSIGAVREVDWYGVLQTFPSDDSTTIKTQYQNIVSLLEPVKNDIIGASLALKFADEAYDVLSDPVKRADYDARKKLSFVGTGNSSFDIASSFGNKRKFPDLYQFEEAQDDDIGTQENINCTVNSLYNFEPGQVWLGFTHGDKMHGRYAKIISILPEKMRVVVNWYDPHPRSQLEKRWCDLGLPVSCGDFLVQESEELEINGTEILSNLLFSCEGNGRELQVYPKKGEVWAIYKNWDLNWDKEILEKCEYELVEIIANYSEDYGVKVAYLVRVEGSKSLFQRKVMKNGNDINSYNLPYLIPSEKLYMFSHLLTALWSNGTFELDPLTIPNNLSDGLLHCSTGTYTGTGTYAVTGAGTYTGIGTSAGTKTSTEFSEGQIWAVFVGPDSMPRSYVKIINIISGTQVQVSFLEPHPMSDEEIQWTEEQLPFSCGVFRKSTETKILHISSFSHIVKCDWTAKKNYYRIFPRKGEVWATFKNRGVNLKNGEYYREQFRMVEILSDYLSEDRKINVGSLTEVEGALTFFERQFCDGFRLTKWVKRTEMLGFSHQVLAFRVTGQKQPGLPEFMLQLEPSALPLPKELQ